LVGESPGLKSELLRKKDNFFLMGKLVQIEFFFCGKIFFLRKILLKVKTMDNTEQMAHINVVIVKQKDKQTR